MVDVLTVDSIAEANKADLQDLKLIWIDVEGHELQVLEGALSTLESRKPQVFLEYTPQADPKINARLRDLLFENFGHVFDFFDLGTELTRGAFGEITVQADLLAVHAKTSKTLDVAKVRVTPPKM